MTEPIAKIKLAPGNVGWYDSLTNIVLTKAQPEAIVYSGKNVINIKKAIKEGKVLLQEGSLSSYKNKDTEEIRVVKNNIPKENKEKIKEIKKETQKDIYKIISEKNDSDTKKNDNKDKKPVANNKTTKKEEVENPIVEVTKDTAKTTTSVKKD